ncbi:MAG: hypothetical protein MRZ79_02215 [Bacteroidia bacterium]|nr:hypothetical protein [Bacteroidia bacterium]
MRYLAILFIAIFIIPEFGFAQAEHEIHLSTIRASRYKKISTRGIQGDSAFIEYVLEYILEAPEDVMFISNRQLLNSLCLSDCSENSLSIHDTLKRRKEVNIKVYTRAFEAESHEISFYEGKDSLIKAVDGRKVYGAVDKLPETQVDSISMTIGKKKIKIPAEAYEDLYDPNLCDGGYFKRPLAVYTSMNGDYMYMYIYGGKSSGTYLAKLIFDKRQYIKKIVAEYEDLLPFDSIRPDFLGF